jgi:hypothetical protein
MYSMRMLHRVNTLVNDPNNDVAKPVRPLK